MGDPKTKLKDIKIGIIGGDAPESIGLLTRSAKNKEYFQGKPKKMAPEKRVKPGRLISRSDGPVNIKYGKDVIRLSPRERAVVANMDLLGELPKGNKVICVPIK